MCFSVCIGGNKKTVAYAKAQYMCKYPVSLAGDCCAPDAIWLI